MNSFEHQPVHRDEPIAIGSALGEAPIWLQGYTDTNRPHPFEGCCKVCNVPLEQPWRLINHPSAPGWHAVNCCDQCYEAAGKSEQTGLSKWFEERCPPEFRPAWDPNYASALLLKKCLYWDWKLKRGLILVGKSGSSKTRAAWKIVEQLSRDNVTWFFATALEVMEGLPAEAKKTKVLVIDDLGNDRLTPAKEIELLKVIRNRVDWHQPIIVTTQYRGRDLSDRFSDQSTAQAIVRRLREFCDPINIDQLAP